jgi:putative transposase
MIQKALKYRLCPTPAQETILLRTLQTCCDVYNSLLNERKHDFEVLGKAPSRYEQQKHFPQWAKTFPEIKAVHSQVLQNIALRVDRAFDAFFRRVSQGETPGFPRMKQSGYDSFTYPQMGFKVLEQSVSLSKIGTLKAILHRPIDGRIKTCTVRRHNGKWFVCFAVEVEPQPLPESSEKVGIDVGLEKFAALQWRVHRKSAFLAPG